MCQCQLVQVLYDLDESRDFVIGGRIAAAGVGIPYADQLAPAWSSDVAGGGEGGRRELFNHSMAVPMVGIA